MALLGSGVYLTPNGAGAQPVTVDKATIVGDEFFAFGVSQATSGSNPTWSPPNPPFTHALDVTALRAASHDGNFGTWVFMAHGAPGVVAAGHVYTFTHDASVSFRTILVLARCNEQILSDGIGGGLATGHIDFPATSPEVLAVNLPLANPGFDFCLRNNKGVSLLVPTGPSPAFTPVAILTSGGDGMDILLSIMLASRNVAYVGNVTGPWGKTAVDGDTILVATAQLGATNTASTLKFPGAVPAGGKGAGFAPGGLYRQSTFQNPGQFNMGPRTGRHFG